jgi:dipeptidyl-peptidase-3
MRQGVGEILSLIMRIKAEGDYQEARSLVEMFGVKINTEWRDQVMKRTQAIDLPDNYALVMPSLSLVKDESGKITDVEISYPQDFMRQQLEYSGKIPNR